VTFAVGEADDCTPTAGAWIAGTSAVCVQAFDCGSCHGLINLLFTIILVAGAIIEGNCDRL
jgi:hypothetical protein